MEEYLNETFFLNFNHINFDNLLKNIDNSSTKKTIAIELYYLIRDSYMYDPYHLDLRAEGLKASNIITKKRAWCVEKSILLAACARRFDIPSKLGYAIVVNHIGVEKLIHYLRRKEIVFHGYVELYLEGKWVKCTPSFDKKICRIANVQPLNWDGENDSMFQEYENETKFMEYIHDYGVFSDVPIELMNFEMKNFYPHLFEKEFITKDFSFFHI